MKMFFALFFLMGSFNAQASDLKSKKLKKMVCDEMADALLFEDIDPLLVNFESDCEKSKFEVLDDKTIFNKDFKKVIGLEVAVDYLSNTGVELSGTVSLRRAPKFDENNGELILAGWTSKSALEYELTEQAIAPLLEVILDAAGAEGGVGLFDPKKTNAKKIEKEIDEVVKEFNEESKQNYIEYELDEDEEFSEDADYCRMYSYEGHNNIKDHSDSRSASELMKKIEKFILFSYSFDNEGGESEYCSQFNTRVYFTDGSFIELFFDFNT